MRSSLTLSGGEEGAFSGNCFIVWYLSRSGSSKGGVGLEGMMPRREGRKEEEKNIPEKGNVC